MNNPKVQIKSDKSYSWLSNEILIYPRNLNTDVTGDDKAIISDDKAIDVGSHDVAILRRLK